MERKKKKKNMALFWPLIAFAVFALFIAFERNGISYHYSEHVNAFVPQAVMDAPKPGLATESLILYDSLGLPVLTNIQNTFDIIDVGYSAVNIKTEAIPDYNEYRTVVLVLQDAAPIRERFVELLDWVEGGGRVLIACPIYIPLDMQSEVLPKLGIVPLYLDRVLQEEAVQVSNFMPGGKGRVRAWSDYAQSDLRYGYNAQLTSDCTVHMEARGEVGSPMLWEHKQGLGKIVYNNSAAFVARTERGVIAGAYSLLEDAFVYPVINASMFFVDDFPAPIPDGTNEYIYRDYKVNIDYFYTNIWFPDMMELARKYGLHYTGMLIETYDDQVKAPFTPINKVHGFEYFGAMMLDEGFEIALHGYNHMPLVLENFDYMGTLPYKKWKTTEDMGEALQEAARFAKQYYPEITLQTYIPPSNVLSHEGRAALKQYLPDINCISGLYHNIDVGMEDDFGIGSDGIINLPRVSFGFILESDHDWNTLDALMLYYVNSHFVHPDDPFDKTRGGEAGWEKMKEEIEVYLSWLKEFAPGLRNMTAQDGAKAVQRYSNISLFRTVRDGKILLDIEGFYDEAWFLMRCNAGVPMSAEGAAFSLVEGNLYLVHATEKHAEIQLTQVEEVAK